MHKSPPQSYKVFLSSPKCSLYPILVNFPIPSTPGNHCSVFCHHRLNLSFLEFHINRIMCIFFCLASSTQYLSRIFLKFTCITAYILPFYWGVMVHCTDKPQFTCWRIFVLFLVFGYYEPSCYEHLCTNLCVKINFPFSWAHTSEG